MWHQMWYVMSHVTFYSCNQVIAISCTRIYVWCGPATPNHMCTTHSVPHERKGDPMPLFMPHGCLYCFVLGLNYSCGKMTDEMAEWGALEFFWALLSRNPNNGECRRNFCFLRIFYFFVYMDGQMSLHNWKLVARRYMYLLEMEVVET